MFEASSFFALNFGVGVVTGIVLEFEFGTNFSRFSQAAGNVIAPLMAFEVMTAFFLESSFLAIMLFGWNRVSRHMHFLATALVAVGTILSSFWILAANSWMQTPTGYRLIDGKFMVISYTCNNPFVLQVNRTIRSLRDACYILDRTIPDHRNALNLLKKNLQSW